MTSIIASPNKFHETQLPAMNDASNYRLAHNVTRLSHMALTGAGQVYVEGGYAYLGHLTNKEKLGTSILDITDPRKPRMVSQIFLDDPNSHSHKARVVGDIMIVNSEQNGSPLGRKGEQLASARTALQQSLGRPPTHAELAERFALKESDIAMLEDAERNPYDQGGFRIYDIKDKTKLVKYRNASMASASSATTRWRCSFKMVSYQRGA